MQEIKEMKRIKSTLRITYTGNLMMYSLFTTINTFMGWLQMIPTIDTIMVWKIQTIISIIMLMSLLEMKMMDVYFQMECFYSNKKADKTVITIVKWELMNSKSILEAIGFLVTMRETVKSILEFLKLQIKFFSIKNV